MGFLDFLRGSLPPGIYVLAYHEVCVGRPPHIGHMSIFTEAVHFEEHITCLSERYAFIGVEDLHAFGNGKSIDAPKFLVTFDDGFVGNYTHAFPRLREKGIPAVVFLITDILGRECPFHWNLALNYIVDCEGEAGLREVLQEAGHAPLSGVPLRSWAMKQYHSGILQTVACYFEKHYSDALRGMFLSLDQIDEMRQHGISFGLHTARHPVMSRLNAMAQKAEIEQALGAFEQTLGVSPVAYAHPYGHQVHFNSDTQEALAQLLPDIPVFSAYGSVNLSALDLRDVRRICVHDYPARTLRRTLRQHTKRRIWPSP